MLSSSLMNAVILNNRAVYALVQEGNLKRASTLLNRALQYFSENLDEDDTEEEAVQDPNALLTNHDQGLRSVPLHERLCVYDNTFCPENAFGIYNHAFFLPYATNDPTHLERDEVASVLLCNFGLVLLKRAILEGRGQSALLGKSLQLYQMALSLLQNQPGQYHNRQENGGGLRLVQLAAWLNRGFIHAYYLEFEDVVSCKDHIKDMIICTTPGNGRTTPLPYPQDFVFFLHAVVHIEVLGLSYKTSPAA